MTTSHPLVNAPIGRTLLRLAAPNIIATLLQTTLSVIDAWYLGQLGANALAGAALVFPLFMLSSMLSAGAIGGAFSGATARALGAGDRERAATVLRSAVVVAVFAAVLMSILLLSYGPALYTLLGGNGAVLESALAYSDVLMSGILAVWLFNMLASVLRGSGDMLRPALAIALVVAVHLPLAGVLTLGWGELFPAFGVRGAAASLVIAYGAGAILLLLMLSRPTARLRLQWGRIPITVWWPVLRAGLLAGNQSIATITLSLLMTAFIGRFGIDWLAGYGIGVRLELLLIPIIFGLGAAMIALAGASLGAGLRERAISIAWYGALLTAGIIATLGITVAIFPTLWSGLFTDDADIAAACARYLSIVGPCYGFFGLGMSLYFASQGLNTLLLPVLGTLLRLTLVASGGWLLFTMDYATPTTVFALAALAMVAYGVFIAASLRFVAWHTDNRS